jgi:hypothetical protein
LNDPRLEAIVELHSMPATGSTQPAGSDTQTTIDTAERTPNIGWPAVSVLDQRGLAIAAIQPARDEYQPVCWGIWVSRDLDHRLHIHGAGQRQILPAPD